MRSSELLQSFEILEIEEKCSTVFVFPQVIPQKYDPLRGRVLNKQIFQNNSPDISHQTWEFVCLDVHVLLSKGCLLVPPTK